MKLLSRKSKLKLQKIKHEEIERKKTIECLKNNFCPCCGNDFKKWKATTPEEHIIIEKTRCCGYVFKKTQRPVSVGCFPEDIEACISCDWVKER